MPEHVATVLASDRPTLRVISSPRAIPDANAIAAAFDTWMLTQSHSDASGRVYTREESIGIALENALAAVRDGTRRNEIKPLMDFLESFQRMFPSFARDMRSPIPKESSRPNIPLSEGLKDRLTLKAKRNQELALFFLQALQPDAPTQMKKEVDNLVVLLNVLKEKRVSLASVALQFINGARAQAGVVNVLSQNGYSLYLLNVQDKAEILAYDVLGHTDIIAVKDHYLLFLDIKGRNSIELPDTVDALDKSDFTKRHIIEIVHPDYVLRPDHRERHEKLREHFISISGIETELSMRHLTIVVPTDLSYMDPIGRLDPQKAGELLGLLHQQHQQKDHPLRRRIPDLQEARRVL